MSFLVFIMHHVSQSLCFSFLEHFMMYVLCLLLFFLKWFDDVLHRKLKVNHPLFIFCGALCGWVAGRVGLLQKVQSHWVYWSLLQGAFLHWFPVRFLPVPMQTVSVYTPSLLCQYFDSSEITVYLKLERAIQHCLMFLLLKSV